MAARPTGSLPTYQPRPYQHAARSTPALPDPVNFQTRLFCGAFASLLIPATMWASLSLTNAIDQHLAYVACLESINLDGISSQAKICRDKQR